MGVLFPRNLKKNPINVVVITRAASICTRAIGTSWPHGETRIIFLGIKSAMALKRSIPKKPSSTANLSLRWCGDFGF